MSGRSRLPANNGDGEEGSQDPNRKQHHERWGAMWCGILVCLALAALAIAAIVTSTTHANDDSRHVEHHDDGAAPIQQVVQVFNGLFQFEGVDENSTHAHHVTVSANFIKLVSHEHLRDYVPVTMHPGDRKRGEEHPHPNGFENTDGDEYERGPNEQFVGGMLILNKTDGSHHAFIKVSKKTDTGATMIDFDSDDFTNPAGTYPLSKRDELDYYDVVKRATCFSMGIKPGLRQLTYRDAETQCIKARVGINVVCPENDLEVGGDALITNNFRVDGPVVHVCGSNLCDRVTLIEDQIGALAGVSGGNILNIISNITDLYELIIQVNTTQTDGNTILQQQIINLQNTFNIFETETEANLTALQTTDAEIFNILTVIQNNLTDIETNIDVIEADIDGMKVNISVNQQNIAELQALVLNITTDLANDGCQSDAECLANVPTSVIAAGCLAAHTCNFASKRCEYTYGTLSLFYLDADEDGFGDPTNELRGYCSAPAGYVSDATDCDDTRDTTYPGAPLRCNLRDNDCSGVIDLLQRGSENAGQDPEGPNGYNSTQFWNLGERCIVNMGGCRRLSYRVCDPIGEMRTICKPVAPWPYSSNNITNHNYTTTMYAVTEASILGYTPPPAIPYSRLSVFDYFIEGGALYDDINGNNVGIIFYAPTTEVLADGIDDDCNGLIDDGVVLECQEFKDRPSLHIDTVTTEVVPVSLDTVYDGVGTAIYAKRSSLCKVEICVTNFADCNLLVDDGCEVDLHRDPSNCGSCGNACAANQRCTNGGCSDLNLGCTTDADCQIAGNPCITAFSCQSNLCVYNVSNGDKYYQDADGDGFGDPDHFGFFCQPPADHVLDNTDCHDSDASIYPGAPRRCNNKDNDCNGIVDYIDTQLEEDPNQWVVGASCDVLVGACLRRSVTVCDPIGQNSTICKPVNPAQMFGRRNGLSTHEMTGAGETLGLSKRNNNYIEYASSTGPGGPPNWDVVVMLVYGDLSYQIATATGSEATSGPFVGFLADLTASQIFANVVASDPSRFNGTTIGIDATPNDNLIHLFNADHESNVREPSVYVLPYEEYYVNGLDDNCDGTIDNGDFGTTGTLPQECRVLVDIAGMNVASTFLTSARPVFDQSGAYVGPNSQTGVAGVTCQIVCDTGYGNCNFWQHDGCETHLLSDPANCNSCGNVCAPNQRCVGGTCTTSNGCTVDADCLISGDPCITNSTCSSGACVYEHSNGDKYYQDFDGDGFGDPEHYAFFCQPPADHVLDNTDCDDSDASIYPGAPLRCNYKDNNCNGVIDYVDTQTLYGTDPTNSSVWLIGYPCLATMGPCKRFSNRVCDPINLNGTICKPVNPLFGYVGVNSAYHTVQQHHHSAKRQIIDPNDPLAQQLAIFGDSVTYLYQTPNGTYGTTPDSENLLHIFGVDWSRNTGEPSYFNIPSEEVYADGVDDNCDGIVDNGGLGAALNDVPATCRFIAEDPSYHINNSFVPSAANGDSIEDLFLGELYNGFQRAGNRGGAGSFDLCLIESCVANWADCDGHFSTGCEVDLSSDHSHCGACNTKCALNNICVEGQCVNLVDYINSETVAVTQTLSGDQIWRGNANTFAFGDIIPKCAKNSNITLTITVKGDFDGVDEYIDVFVNDPSDFGAEINGNVNLLDRICDGVGECQDCVVNASSVFTIQLPTVLPTKQIEPLRVTLLPTHLVDRTPACENITVTASYTANRNCQVLLATDPVVDGCDRPQLFLDALYNITANTNEDGSLYVTVSYDSVSEGGVVSSTTISGNQDTYNCPEGVVSGMVGREVPFDINPITVAHTDGVSQYILYATVWPRAPFEGGVDFYSGIQDFSLRAFRVFDGVCEGTSDAVTLSVPSASGGTATPLFAHYTSTAAPLPGQTQYVVDTTHDFASTYYVQPGLSVISNPTDAGCVAQSLALGGTVDTSAYSFGFAPIDEIQPGATDGGTTVLCPSTFNTLSAGFEQSYLFTRGGAEARDALRTLGAGFGKEAVFLMNFTQDMAYEVIFAIDPLGGFVWDKERDNYITVQVYECSVDSCQSPRSVATLYADINQTFPSARVTGFGTQGNPHFIVADLGVAHTENPSPQGTTNDYAFAYLFTPLYAQCDVIDASVSLGQNASETFNFVFNTSESVVGQGYMDNWYPYPLYHSVTAASQPDGQSDAPMREYIIQVTADTPGSSLDQIWFTGVNVVGETNFSAAEWDLVVAWQPASLPCGSAWGSGVSSGLPRNPVHVNHRNSFLFFNLQRIIDNGGSFLIDFNAVGRGGVSSGQSLYMSDESLPDGQSVYIAFDLIRIADDDGTNNLENYTGSNIPSTAKRQVGQSGPYIPYEGSIGFQASARGISKEDAKVFEGGSYSACSDGVDNDNDGLVDCEEPCCAGIAGCRNAASFDEQACVNTPYSSSLSFSGSCTFYPSTLDLTRAEFHPTSDLAVPKRSAPAVRNLANLAKRQELGGGNATEPTPAPPQTLNCEVSGPGTITGEGCVLIDQNITLPNIQCPSDADGDGLGALPNITVCYSESLLEPPSCSEFGLLENYLDCDDGTFADVQYGGNSTSTVVTAFTDNADGDDNWSRSESNNTAGSLTSGAEIIAALNGETDGDKLPSINTDFGVTDTASSFSVTLSGETLRTDTILSPIDGSVGLGLVVDVRMGYGIGGLSPGSGNTVTLTNITMELTSSKNPSLFVYLRYPITVRDDGATFAGSTQGVASEGCDGTVCSVYRVGTADFGREDTWIFPGGFDATMESITSAGRDFVITVGPFVQDQTVGGSFMAVDHVHVGLVHILPSDCLGVGNGGDVVGRQ